MDEKPTTKRRSRSTSPSSHTSPNAIEPTRKSSISSTHGTKHKSAEIARIDALATAPGVSMASFAHLDEKAILRKMDLRLIPMLALLYLLSFLDRGNIGNAKIEGLTEDLGITGAQYNWCLTVFFFTYAAFEVPSNLLLKKLRPSVWLPTIMVAWGLVMTLMGIVQNYEGLLIARIFLGVAEAGLFPGVAYYITMWYARHEAQFRQALFFSAASVAGAFSGLLAFGIAHMDGVGGLEGWRWIFILEGILTVVVAVVAFFVLYDFPETATFLTEEERAFVVYRLKYQDFKDEQEDGAVRVAQDDTFQWKFVKSAFLDWQIWTNVWVYWGELWHFRK
jgi:MFS family permease